MTVSLLRARATFWWGQRVINAGDIVSSTDPVAKGRAHLFDPIETAATVEQATAAPGERRTVHRPK